MVIWNNTYTNTTNIKIKKENDMAIKTSCYFTISDGILTVGNKKFSKNFSGIAEAKMEQILPKGRSLPYFEVSATKEDGSSIAYQMWEDLPIVRITKCPDNILLELEGQHWIVKSAKLNAFTDECDTLVEENEQSFYKRGIFAPIEGDIFFLEDPESEKAIVMISETPDWIRGKLSIPITSEPNPEKVAKLSISNGGYPIVLGFCDMGECEALCRNYFRHANHCEQLVTMSNTWGDRNGSKRVCEDFIRREIEAAKEIGIDIVQIDDGWQCGDTLYRSQHDDRNNRMFDEHYWDINRERFPNGIRSLSNLAAELGIKIGIWFAPSSHDCFAKLERDKSVLRKAYENEGARFFKLDMYQAPSKESTDKMLELLDSVYSLGDDVSVQMDVTRYERLNYLCGREYGTIFVENRFTSGIYTYYPHRVLRNLWSISKYLPSNRFQFEIVNPDVSRETYSDNDPFATDLYDMDYLFASVMLSNPLFWQEIQFLPEKRRKELAPLLSVWKEHRDVLSSADVMPIGDKPSGRSFTGFYVSKDEKPKYLLLFREVTKSDHAIFNIPVSTAKAEILASNTDVNIEIQNGIAAVKFAKPRGYAFIKLN